MQVNVEAHINGEILMGIPLAVFAFFYFFLLFLFFSFLFSFDIFREVFIVSRREFIGLMRHNGIFSRYKLMAHFLG